MKEIILYGKRKGLVLVDDEDYERLNQYKWYLNKDGYVGRSLNTEDRLIVKNGGEFKPKYTRIHREVLNFPIGQIDHKDRNRLNNQKSNLRLSTQQQNVVNSTKRTNTFSKYKGAFWHKTQKRWLSAIKINGKSKHLGIFNTEIEAAIAYNEAVKKHFGEFGVLNIIENE